MKRKISIKERVGLRKMEREIEEIFLFVQDNSRHKMINKAHKLAKRG